MQSLNRFIALALGVVLVAASVAARADFGVAREVEIESRPAVAFNAQTGEFFVAYLERQSDILGNPVELRVRRFNQAGVQQGATLQPLGSASHEALGRPAIAYGATQNVMLVTVPVKKDGFSDRVLGRFLAANGSNLVGPDFLFDDNQGFYDDGQTDDGNGSLQVTYNSLLDEFVVTVQRTVAGNNGVWAQKLSTTTPGTIVLLNNHGINGQHSHDIEFAAVATNPPGGRYLFINNGTVGALKVMDTNLGTVTAISSVDWGEPNGGINHHNIAFGRIEGKNRWLMVWADDDNCRPGFFPCAAPEFQWSGIWGTYIDPLNPNSGNTPFPISKIWSHIASETIYKPRVAYNRDAETFYIVWRELPVLHAQNDESRSHIRGNRVDYFVANGVPDALVPLPYDNVVVSDLLTGTCPPSGPCFSAEDPTFADVSSNKGFGAAVVWQEKYVLDPSDLDIWGDQLNPPVPDNDTITSPLVIDPADPPLEVTLVGSFNDGSATCGDSADSPDVWFLVDPPVSGTLVVNTCGSNDLYGEDTGMDTVLSLHRGDGVQINAATCNDDSPAGTTSECAGRDSGSLRDSALEYHMNGGELVYVRVSRYVDSYGGRFILNHGFEPDIDSDGDGIADQFDNCSVLPNPAQRDTDGDAFGNRCDGDFNNDCIVNTGDLGYLRTVFFSADPLGDLDGDGVVNVADLGILRTLFFLPPGPSGLPNACTP